MKVWWCEVHNAEAVNNDDLPEEQTECWLYLGLSLGEKPIAPCRMVEMQLVPADALVIQKENGKWPSWTKEERWSDTSTPPKRRHTLVVFLDVPHD